MYGTCVNSVPILNFLFNFKKLTIKKLNIHKILNEFFTSSAAANKLESNFSDLQEKLNVYTIRID